MVQPTAEVPNLLSSLSRRIGSLIAKARPAPFPKLAFRAWAKGVAFALAATMAVPGLAQEVVRIVVPFGPGAVLDTIAQTFQAELGKALGATVVVEHRPGAGGLVGTASVAKSAPGAGGALLLTGASHTLIGHLYAKLPYDPIKDFVGVSYIGYSGYVIAAPASLGTTSLNEYVTLLKDKPGQLNYASAGTGSTSHMGMAYFLGRAGVSMQHVPMKSTGEALNELLAGRVQGVASAVAGILPWRNDPRIRLLAYTGPRRSRFLPDLPTVAESAVPGFRYDSWVGLLAPATMPRREIERLNAAMRKVLADPVVQRRLSGLGIETATMNIDEFQQLLHDDWSHAAAVVKASGAQLSY